MAQTIKDGASGNIAEVDSTNRLHVASVTTWAEEQAGTDGVAFILHSESHTAAAASGGLLYFKNTSTDYNYHITRIYIDPHTITPTDLLVTQIKEPATKSNGTDISSTGIINKNFESGNTLTATLVTSDGSSDMTFTGGSQYHSFPIKTMTSTQRDMRGTNVITPGATILWGWETAAGGNATNGEVIAMSINLYRVARS